MTTSRPVPRGSTSGNGRHFYHFLGIHAFLTGLFPFFIPVFLWRLGYDLASLGLFIAFTGTGFVLSLIAWDRLRGRVSFHHLIALTFLVEIALLSALFLQHGKGFLLLFGLLNGAYNCFFWITQRTLFFETLSADDAGRKVGNFQIFVVVVLKAGIFCGGLLLDKAGYLSVYLLSLLIGTAGALSFLLQRRPPELPPSLKQAPPLGLAEVRGFRDPYRSRAIFLVDGPFLFLESYFWAVSLFLVARQSFWKLGLLVIVLGVTFSLLFWLIKNRIDRLPPQKIYVAAVAGYALSWSGRALADPSMRLEWLFLLLVLVTFATSFFRLAFNKRFFDLARHTSAHRYLLLKSYYSQAAIVLVFLVTAGLAALLGNDMQMLDLSYLVAAAAASLYLLYRPGRTVPDKID